MPLEHEALTERIIGAAIEVHRRLGPGFLESAYEKSRSIIELKKRGFGGAGPDGGGYCLLMGDMEVCRHRMIFLWKIRSS